jgi:cobalt transporter subunit CbtA
VIRRILLVGLAAGGIAGLAAFALGTVWVAPLIAAAEALETGAAAAGGASGLPAGGLERVGLTLAAHLSIGVGFGLLLAAALAVAGRTTDWRSGLAWGAAGFTVFALAPALGLPPEPPGMAAAALPARQWWWLGTVAATASGLALLLGSSRPWLRVAAVLLLALPHLVGAPPPPTDPAGPIPADLAARYVAATLGVGALFWAVLGAAGGHLFGRAGRRR